MFRTMIAILVGLATVPAVCQTKSKYQVGTIVAVERNRDADTASPDGPSYDLSIQVARTIYVVRYRPEFGLRTVEYAAGRDLPVLIGDNTLTCNDLLGRSHELPIIRQQPVPAGTHK